MSNRPAHATAFAPATVANVAVGFDVLGYAFDGVGDHVTVTQSDSPGVRIKAVAGVEVPRDPAQNTAGVALQAMLDGLGLEFGLEVELVKGIPVSSGLGGSAASAVGAVVAANGLLERPCSTQDLLPFALAGEALASGAVHGDNVVPCLFGGLVAVMPGTPMPPPVRLPVPDLHCVLVRPQVALDTRTQRQVLPEEIPLAEHVRQSAYLAGFVAAAHAGDLQLLGECMQDLVVGPRRAAAIPGCASMRAAALAAGAVGCGIAGSGPTVFAWCAAALAAPVGEAMLAALQGHGVAGDLWSGPMGGDGARLVVEVGR